MHRVQCCPCRRRNPCAVGARLRMHCFNFIHVKHFIRHRPHAFTDLCLAHEACLKTRIYIPILIGNDPWLLFHFSFWDHRASLHACMNFISSSIQESRIDKNDSIFCSANTFFKIHGCSPLLIHNSNFGR